MRFSVSKLFENLFYRKLQFDANAFEFCVGPWAEIDLEAFEDRNRRGFCGDNLTDGLARDGHAFTLQMKP